MSSPTASQRIAAELRARIESGELGPGELLPSARQITREWRVAVATATRVHAALRAAGLAETVPGVGVVVRRQTSRTRPAGPLRTEALTAAAIAIADAEGLEAVSMRRLAADLDIGAMSLYRHVAHKDDLLLKMLDTVLREWRPPERGDAGWRECLEAAAWGLWQLFRRHPWLASALSLSRPQTVPSGIAWTEWVLDALDGMGLDSAAALDIHLTLFAFIRGTAINLESEAAATASSGLDAEQWIDTQLPALRGLVGAEEHPHFAELVHTPYDFSLDRIFELGLRYLLDGLAVELERGRPAGR